MWSWEQVDHHRSSSSGDLAKIFKNEHIRHPGFLARNAPSHDAVLLAREVIQNSWDAARELVACLPPDDPHPGFQISFHFEELTGSTRSAFAKRLGLKEHAQRLQRLGESRQSLGVSDDTLLSELNTRGSLNILRIEEAGAIGMPGRWEGTQSRLYLAMVSLGFTQKQAGAGGSFGYGKAGLIRGSRVRIVIAYTCFQAQPDEPTITRRLLGMTYWGPHEVDGASFTGFARFGVPESTSVVVPFENEEADRVASGLGIPVRDPESIDDLGTTFLLIEPSCNPDDLNEAIVRNWWPALVDHEFSVLIHPGRPGAKTLIPRPAKNVDLRPFIKAYEIAKRPQDNAIGSERRKHSVSLNSPNAAGRTSAGQLGLVTELSDWSYPLPGAIEESGEPIDQAPHRSLVALIRGPKMVVEYLNCGSNAPFVRGVFVAHTEVDDLLRQAEPAAHDRWETEPATGVDPLAASTASRVLKAIRRRVDEFRSALRPPPAEVEEIQLPELGRLFGGLWNGSDVTHASPARSSSQDPISFTIEETSLRPAADGSGLVFTARAALGLVDVVNSSSQDPHGNVLVELQFRYQFIEDGRRGEEVSLEHLKVGGEDVRGETDSHWTSLTMKPGGWVTVELKSSPYPSDLTCALYAEARIADRRDRIRRG